MARMLHSIILFESYFPILTPVLYFLINLITDTFSVMINQ